MKTQGPPAYKLPEANLALVFSGGMLWSWRWLRSDVALSMRCVAGSANSCLVAPCLEQNKQLIAAYNHVVIEGENIFLRSMGDSTLPHVEGESTLPHVEGENIFLRSRGESTLPHV